MKRRVTSCLLAAALLLTACGGSKSAPDEDKKADKDKSYVELAMDKYKEHQENKKEEAEAKSQEGNDKTMKIKSIKDLQKFADRVADGEEALGASLEADLDLSEVCGESKGSWEAIESYNGIFDGQGHTIGHLYITGDDDGGLFFRLQKDSVVKNLNLTDVTIDVNGSAGSITRESVGVIENCTSSGSVKGTGEGVFVGGIVGSARTVTDCQNTAAVEANGGQQRNIYASAGGVVGRGRGKITGCVNSGEVRADQGWTGGIVGFADKYDEDYFIIDGCSNSGSVQSGNVAGGILGCADNGLLDHCVNTGSVTGGYDSGGVLGAVMNDLKSGVIDKAMIINSCNKGDILATTEPNKEALRAGGIAGSLGGDDSYMANCYSLGSVSVLREGENFKAGIAGGLTGSSSHGVYNCYTMADLSSKSGSDHDWERGIGIGLDYCQNVFFLNGMEKKEERVGSGTGDPSDTTAEQFADGTVLTALQNGWNDSVVPEITTRLEEQLKQYDRSMSDMSGWKAGSDGTPCFDWE